MVKYSKEVISMLKNNNTAIINRLARNNISNNMKRFVIMFFTISLSSFMLVCILTTGKTYLDSRRMQDTRLYGAQYDITTMNGFTPQQLKTLQKNKEIESVGIESYAGYISATQFDASVDVGLLWCDEVFWNQQMAPARTELNGYYPKKKNELMVTKDILKAFGNEKLNIGDHLTITFVNNTGVHEETLTISGIWEGYGHDSVCFVSKAFYDETGYSLENDGVLCIKLKQNYVFPSTVNSIKKSLKLSSRQVFQQTSYIENSLKLLAGICGLALIICLSAYLLIYNILYLSVLGKIRYYGLLQSLGMTKKQLVSFIAKQMLFITASATATGIILAYLTCLKILPYLLSVLGIANKNQNIDFQPLIIVLCMIITGTAVILGIRKPLKIAVHVSPVEAVKYHIQLPKEKKYKTTKKFYFWRMALAQLMKDKKKTLIVLLSLSTSLSVFYCLTTIITTQGQRTVLPNYANADLIIKNHTQTTEDINSLKPALETSMISMLKDNTGIREFHVVYGIPIVFPYTANSFSSMWIEKYIEKTPYLAREDVISDYQNNPEKYYGMLKGIDEKEFDYLSQFLSSPVDKENFLDGKTCLISCDDPEISKKYVQQSISFNYQNKQYQLSIAGIYNEPYYSGTNIGATLIVSQKYLQKICSNPYALNIAVYYQQKNDNKTENEILSLCKKSPYFQDIYIDSLLENMKTIEKSQGDMMIIGTVISCLLLLTGILNYNNTIAGAIYHRKLTFSIMESLGMTSHQIKQLLLREGLLYAGFSILITISAGTAITYISFQSMNYMSVPFQIPVQAMITAFLLIIIICMITPVLSYHRLNDDLTIAERLRKYQ